MQLNWNFLGAAGEGRGGGGGQNEKKKTFKEGAWIFSGTAECL